MSARNTAAQMAVNPTVNHGPDQWRYLVSRTDPPPNVLAAIIDTANAATPLPSPRLIGTSYRAANLPMLTASAETYHENPDHGEVGGSGAGEVVKRGARADGGRREHRPPR